MRLVPPGFRWPRQPRTYLWLAVVAGVLAIIVVGLFRVQIETGVDEFVPTDDDAATATEEVAERFGGDPVVVLLESDKAGQLLLKDNLPDLMKLEGDLAKLPDVAAVYGPGTVLNQIAGQAQTLLAELSGYRDALRAGAEEISRKNGASATEVKAAGVQATQAFDARYGDLLAQGMPGGLPTLHNQKFVDQVIFNDEGDPRPQWDFLVPRPDAIAILVRPEASLPQSRAEDLVSAVEATVNDSEVTAKRTTVTGVPSIVAALGEQIRHEVPLLGGIAVIAVGAWFLLTSWTRRRLRLLPLGATVLGTSATLALAGWTGRPLALTAVAFLPVLLGIGSDFMTYLHRGVGPRAVIAAAAASVAGFAALMIAPVPAVADLGLSLAIGLVVTVLVSLAVHRWGPPEGEAPPVQPRRLEAGRPVRWAAVAATAVVAAVGWSLFPSLSIQSDFTSLASGLQKYDDAQRVQRIVGSSGEVSVVVRGKDVLSADSFNWMTQSRREIIAEHGDELSPILSPADVLSFLGTDPEPSQVDAAMSLLPEYLSTSVVTPERDMAIMTFGVDLDDVDRLRTLRDYLEDLAATAPDSVEVEVAGLPMVAVSAHEAIQDDRMLGALLGIAAAGLALLLLLRDLRLALVAAGSAGISSGLVALGMWLTGIALTPMTAGLGSLTAAVACEFTVMLAFAQRSGDGRLARAVDLAAAASGTGYLVLVVSDLGLIRGFGLLLGLTVAVSLVVSRLLVWALLPEAQLQDSDADPGAGPDAGPDSRTTEPKVLEVVG